MIITTKNHIVKSRSEFLNVFVVMALTSLAFLTMVRALTIDNQLAVIKNDCYERMAIGQRLSPKDVYKTSNVNTVLNCQMTCTQEQSLCKSFSFGIGVKGNATCELSTDPVKETPDLKPIGTIADTDFDLYIKKLDCTLVIDKNHPHDHYGGEPPTLTSKPPISPGGSDSYGSPQHHVEIQRPGYESNQNNKPHQTVGYDRPHEDHHYGKPQVFEKPFPGDYDRPQNQNKPHQSIGYDRPEDYHIGKPQVFEKPPSGGYDGPQNQNHDQNRPPGDSVEHVQTLVSVSTGGQRPILHPVHEILIGEAAYNYAYPKPPFRPDFLNQPYHKPSRPEHDYHHFSRPGLHDKPNYYDYFDKYGPDYPYYSYQHPRPDDFDNPNYFEPIGAGYPDKFERPHRPSRPNTDYLFNQDPDNRPSRPQNSPGNYLSNQDPDSRPSRPQNNLENRPTKPGESAGYGDNSDSKPGANYDSAKPDRPQHDPNNPNTGSYQNKRPNDQTSYDSSIVNSINNGPSKPKDPHSKKPIVTQSVGPYGERITSIITELTQACFRRALAGKRVARGFVKRSLFCERIEDCQRECADEKRFVCEGFNYRLDPNGREKGECELLDLPLSRLDIGRDVYPDPDYDYYERDRNAATIHCHKGHYRPPNEGYSSYYDRPYDRPSGGHDGYFYDRPAPYNDDRRRPPPPIRPGNYDDRFDSGYGRPPLRPIDRRYDSADRDYLPAPHRFDNNDRRRYPPLPPSGGGAGGGDGHRRGDFAYDHHTHHHTTSSSQHHHSSSQQSYHFNNDHRGIHYLPPNPDYPERNRPTYHNSHDQRPAPEIPPPYYNNHHAPPPRPHQQQHHDLPYDYKSYEPYLPPPRPNDTPRRPAPSYHNQIDKKYYVDRERDQNYWGYNRNTWGSSSYGHYGAGGGGESSSTSYHSSDHPRRNYYLPSRVGGTKDWGQYGGSYGNGGFNLQYNGYGHSQIFDYWGFDKYDARYNSNRYHNQDRYDHGTTGGLLPPHKRPAAPGGNPGEYGRPSPQYGGDTYLVPRPPPKGGSYLPEPPPRYLPPQIGGGGSYLPDVPPPKFPEKKPLPPSHGGGYLPNDDFPNSLLPAEPRYPGHSFKDECSLRSVTGFKLHKGIVKKFFAVPSLYECELLCFKEKEFPCASYAYRYTVSLSGPTDNCYLSNRNYKELDHYTDLQPDRDFDIYTMNNQKKCEQPLVIRKRDSECFWRVRSAARLDHAVVRDSLTTKSIVECQIECLKSRRFTCRAFSFRYGSPTIGGAIDNCQLTDWPYYELDPKIHFIPEPGFELYERGSFGHGCEPYHFGVRGNKPWKDPGTRADQLCYIGFGHPAKILPQATKKAINVATEHDCKVECSKLREQTLFQCMSFSYRTNGPRDSPNCLLSDILQRDLLPHVDYVPDPDWWLFVWDNYNPECIFLANEPVHNHIIGGKDAGIENRKGIFYDPVSTLDTWRIYSVSGWPCRQGTFCQENSEAGFWFCELEGGDANTWDYCCRPNHQCGYSEGYSYQWCYVGPVRTQWRKCSERYYPYIHNLIDRVDGYGPAPSHHPHVPPSGPPSHHGGSHHDNLIWDKWSHPPPADHIWRPSSPPYRPGLRPDRPQAPPTAPPPRPSLDEYEMQFDTQFLEPPKPGGFGQPRRWPVSYLHMEKPPNSTMTNSDVDNDIKLNSVDSATRGRSDNPKFQAIQNLIDVIKSNDLKNVQYQITNESNKEDDILFVKIPLPTNFTQQREDKQSNNTAEKLASLKASPANMSQPIDLKSSDSNKRSQKSLPSSVSFKNDGPANVNGQVAPVYRRSYITRTNVTNRSGGSSGSQFRRSFLETQ